MHYNPEISLGTIIETVSVILAVIGASVKFGKLEQKMNIMYNWFENTVINHSTSTDAKRLRETKEFYGAD